jgi:uncharacterized protein
MGSHNIYEWDDDKDALNIQKHGVPLRYASYIFDDPYHFTDVAKDDNVTGEKRYLAVGVVLEYVMCCIYVFRENKIRIISLMRKSGRLEREYRKNMDKVRIGRRLKSV